ncbi:MAG: hypothetical protein ACQERB_15900 [Promethearchaeati archaeon]
MNPFRRFVATGEITEHLGLVDSRRELLTNIKTIIGEDENFILPLIGEIGVGKTHLFWALKSEVRLQFNTIYISLDNIYKKFYYNLYSEFIDELGLIELRRITNNLCNKWGAYKKRYGFFQVVDMQKARKNAFIEWKDSFSNITALEEAINVITCHQLDPYNKIEAENYLLGELMNIRELLMLNVENDLRKKQNAYTMLKILIENSKYGTIIFIDDFEIIISLLKGEEEKETYFDSSWLYGAEESPDSIAAKKILKKIMNLLNIKGLRIIITLNSVKSLEEIKELITEKNKDFLMIFKKPRFLYKFEKEDIFNFYKNNMKLFLKNVKRPHLLEEIENPYYPLNEELLKKIYNKTNGNPRKIIKALIEIFNKIIYDNKEIEEILKENNTDEYIRDF